MHITDCTAGDVDALSALERECIVCPWRRDDILQAVDDDNVVFLKAETDGRLQGYAAARVLFDEAETYNVAVRQDYRRQGIGEALLRELIIRLRARGVKKMYLEVAVCNEPAYRLYGKLGFTVSYERKKYYGADSAYVMELSL